MIVGIHDIIEQNKSGIRKIPGIVLKSELSGEIVYTPPSGKDELVKLAVIYYKFECIHPLYYGNGRVGRRSFIGVRDDRKRKNISIGNYLI